jgi:hypothetical protein
VPVTGKLVQKNSDSAVDDAVLGLRKRFLKNIRETRQAL